MNKKRIGLCGVALVAMGLMLIACGDDDGGNGGAQFRGRVIDFASGKADPVPKPGMTVVALNDETGESLNIEAVADSMGYVTFEGLPEGRVGFLSVGVTGETVDTYQFNIDSAAQDEILWSVDLGTYQMAPALAGYAQDGNKGAAAGATYWLDAQGNEVPVGCSTIQGDYDSGDIRYFGDNNLPTKLLADDPDDGRDNINPLNGYWLVGNIVPVNEPVIIEGFMDTQSLGTVRYFAYPNSVSIGNIYYEGASNPQPSDCQ